MPPVSTAESVHTSPTRRTTSGRARLIYVMEGAALLQTEEGSSRVLPGTTVAVGAEVWCALMPLPAVRVWTVSIDEAVLRTIMSWALPMPERVIAVNAGANIRQLAGVKMRQVTS